MFLPHLACSLALHPMRSHHTTLIRAAATKGSGIAASSILPPTPTSPLPRQAASSFPSLESILPPPEFPDARLLCLELDSAPRSCYCCARSSSRGSIPATTRKPSDMEEVE